MARELLVYHPGRRFQCSGIAFRIIDRLKNLLFGLGAAIGLKYSEDCRLA
jgi:hypothetical protein